MPDDRPRNPHDDRPRRSAARAPGSKPGRGRPSGASTRRDAQRLAELVEPVVVAAGYDLEGLTLTSAGRRSLVRVVVDSDTGVDLDDVASVSRAISAALDEGDGIVGPAPYVLEVTSPGVDRPLAEPRHWRRSVGRLVKIDFVDGASKLGRVLAADDHGADVDVDGGREWVDFSAVRSARVQVEFNHPEGGRS